jgi:hypothetical protein
MRAILLVSLFTLLVLPTAIAQTAAPSTSAPSSAAPAARTRGGDITRDEYVERARRAAERRFDRMDANHDGVLTADERRAAREQRGQRRSTQPAQ